MNENQPLSSPLNSSGRIAAFGRVALKHLCKANGRFTIVLGISTQVFRILAIVLALLLTFACTETHAVTVAHWRFESGNMGVDSSGNGNNLTINGVTSSSDIPANARGLSSAVFDGLSASAQTASTLNLSSYSAITIECFMKTSQTNFGAIYEHTPDQNANPGGFLFSRDLNPGKVSLAMFTSPGFLTRNNILYPADGGWHHYAAVINPGVTPSTMQIYIDGVLTGGTGTSNNKRFFPDNFFFIGSRGGNSLFFNGQLDEIRISGRALPPTGFLIANVSSNAAVVINQNPTNTTVLQSRQAVFTAVATITNGDPVLVEYQWQVNGVDIPGATASSYTLPMATIADNGSQFRVVVSAPSINLTPIISSSATLTVQPDNTSPQAISTFALASTSVGVRFNEKVDSAYANNPSLYSLNQAGTSIDTAELQPDGVTVMLSVSGLTASQYVLTCSGIADLAGNPGTNSVSGTNMGLTLLDIGSVFWNGHGVYSDPTQYTVIAGGRDESSTADGFNYIYQTFTGNFDLRVRLDNVGNGNQSSRGGVEVREDASPGSRHITAATYGAGKDNHWIAYSRAATDGATATDAYVTRPAGFAFPNAWLRIIRFGQTFTSYYSTNGMDWVQLGSSIRPSSDYPSQILVGLSSCAVTLQGNHSVNFDYSNYSVTALPPTNNAAIILTQQPTNTIRLEARPAVFSVVASVTNGYPTVLDYQWKFNGVDIPGATSSAYTLPHVTLNDQGSYSVTVLAPGLSSVTSSSATLTVLPDNTPPQAVSTFALASTSVGVRFDEELQSGSANNPGSYSLNQAGATVDTAELQSDGVTVMLGVSGLTNSQYVLAYTSIADWTGNSASGNIAGNNLGLTFLDIGRVDQPGLLFYGDSSQYTVKSGGYDTAANDGFNFNYQIFTGDFDLRVQLMNVVNANNSSVGGVMVREDTNPGSRDIHAVTYGPTADNHWVTSTRATTNGTTSIPGYPADPTGYTLREPGFSFPNAWLRIVRFGQKFASYHSTNGVDWVQMGPILTPNPPYPSQVLVGIASCAKTIQGNHRVDFTYGNYSVSNFLVAAPQLQINIAGGNAVISWPNSIVDFSLQETAAVGGVWTGVTNAPALSGNRRQVTTPLTGSAKFYRLIH